MLEFLKHWMLRVAAWNVVPACRTPLCDETSHTVQGIVTTYF